MNITGAIISLDATESVVDEAIEAGLIWLLPIIQSFFRIKKIYRTKLRTAYHHQGNTQQYCHLCHTYQSR